VKERAYLNTLFWVQSAQSMQYGKTPESLEPKVLHLSSYARVSTEQFWIGSRGLDIKRNAIKTSYLRSQGTLRTTSSPVPRTHNDGEPYKPALRIWAIISSKNRNFRQTTYLCCKFRTLRVGLRYGHLALRHAPVYFKDLPILNEGLAVEACQSINRKLMPI